jgi:hypothetical protein
MLMFGQLWVNLLSVFTHYLGKRLVCLHIHRRKIEEKWLSLKKIFGEKNEEGSFKASASDAFPGALSVLLIRRAR